MKTLRSRFRMIALVFFCAFAAVLFLCARAAGKLPASVPGPEIIASSPPPEAGNTPAPEESLYDSLETTPSVTETEAPSPAVEYNTYGL